MPSINKAASRAGKPTRSLHPADIRALLKFAVKTNFTDKAAVDELILKHGQQLDHEPASELYKSTEDGILHILVKEKENFNYENLKPFIRWLLCNRKSLFSSKGEEEQNALTLALQRKNDGFVALLLEMVEDFGIFHEPSSNGSSSYLYKAMKSKSHFTTALIAKASNAARGGPEVDLFMKKDHAGLTPLHVAVYAPDTWDEEEREIGEYDEEDLYSDDMLQYYMQDDTGSRKETDSPLKDEVGTESTASNKLEPLPGLKRSRTDLHEQQKRALHSMINTRLNPGKELVEELRSPHVTQLKKDGDHHLQQMREEMRFNRFNVVKDLIEASPRVLVDCEDNEGHTPFQARLETLQIDQDYEITDEADREKRVGKDKIAQYIRQYCIRSFSRQDTIKALYKTGQERSIEFDLTGLPHSSIDTDFLDGLGELLHFEGLLKYVALPRLFIKDDDEIIESNTNLIGVSNQEQSKKVYVTTERACEQALVDKSNSKGKGLSTMCKIFQWLREHHVQGILNVTVIDDAEPSHSDEAIEECLAGFQVESWNWQKVDLCSQVIIGSSKETVRDVTLCFSGNNAVLTGWASLDGLLQLPHGLESQDRLDQYMSNFRAKLEFHKPKIRVEWLPEKGARSLTSSLASSSPSIEESKWMKCMKGFAGFLNNSKPNESVRPVKVAIIDDGINVTPGIFRTKVKGGESFHRLGEFYNRRGAYYAPSGPHGTLMAQLICEICPRVNLYMGQLEVLSGRDNQRSFTIESAAEAVDWAIKREVDIISMSWSITTNEEATKLKDMIHEADKKNILMFCASIDQGPSAVDFTMPGKTGLCFKIGASTGLGTKLSWVSADACNFLLPADGIEPLEIDAWSHIPSNTFGSSVSTVLAAGLAGAIIYADRLMTSVKKSHEMDAKPYGKKTEDYFRRRDHMTRAFEILSANTEWRKFPQVWDYLPADPQAMVWDENLGELFDRTRGELERFLNGLRVPEQM